MPQLAQETAYFFNRQIPAVALIAKGVRLPGGTWTRIADAKTVPWIVEQRLGQMYSDLKGAVVNFAVLTSEDEVKAFERSLAGAP